MKKLTLFSLSFILLAACGNKGAETSQPTTIVASIQPSKPILILDSIYKILILNDTTQSYQLYIPAKASDLSKVSVIVFFDPHGAGYIPIGKYKYLANQLGVVLVGSNSSQNGQSEAQSSQIANNLLSDLTVRMGCNPSLITLCGFSGGAKVALNYGANNAQIGRVIYMGAALPIKPSHPLALFGFAGQQDMNYSDLLQFAAQFENTNSANLLIEWQGKHEWLDEQHFQYAILWLLHQVSGQSKTTDSLVISKAFKNLALQRETCKRQTDAIGEEQYLHLLAMLTDTKICKEELSKLHQSTPYLKAFAQRQQVLQNETAQKQLLLAAFQNQNSEWWAKVIKGYTMSQNPSDKRLLGFISLACYSYSTQLLKQNNQEGAAKILDIYELADPTNTDQLYFHAQLNASQGNAEKSMVYLQKAVKNGFTDKGKIEAEPAFSTLKTQPRFTEILVSLSKPK